MPPILTSSRQFLRAEVYFTDVMADFLESGMLQFGLGHGLDADRQLGFTSIGRFGTLLSVDELEA